MTKFIIRDGNKLFLKERTHVDNMFLGSSFRETDLRTELKPDSIKKIFENPITAIAYDTTHYQHNIEMDKKSLTKALDFWINDKVLQNEKILFIEGKLDDVHEIELKNLIELREFVQKQDNDTVFTRFRESVSGKEYDFTKKSSWGVEFFVKRELVPNNIKYNYTSLFIGDGARWDFGSLLTSSDWFSNAFSTATDHTSEALNELSRALSRSNGAGTDVTQGDPNPYNWRVSRMGNGVTFGLFDQNDALIRINNTLMNNFPSTSAAEESRRQHRIVWDRRQGTNTGGGGGRWIRQNQFNPTNYRIVYDVGSIGGWRIVDNDGTNIAVGFNSETDAQRFVTDHISNTMNRTFTLPAADTETQMVGIAEERLSPGDLITMNPNTRRWRKAVMGSDIGPFLVNVRPVAFGEIVEAVREGSFTVNVGSEPRLRTEPEHPSLPSFDPITHVATVPTPEDRPLQMGDTVVFDRVSNSFRRANDNDTQRIRLTNEDQSPEFLRWVLTGTFVIPGDNMHLMPGEMLSINNDDENIMLVNAPVADELHSGDIITLVTLNGESRWRKVEGSGPDHLLHSNLHPGITSPPPSNRIQDITFENLTIHPLSETLEAGGNSYIMTTYAAQNGQYEIDFQLYVTGREIDRISEGFRTHTLRIEGDRERGRMEIDGELYHYVNYTIRERIREVDIEKRFTNMYLKEIASRARALAQEHPFIYELTFENPEDGVEMEMGIIRSTTAFENPSDGARVFNDIIMELRNGGLHNIRILPGSDHLIQIGRYRFRLDGQPVRVTWSSR